MEREACVCDHGFERSDLCAEIIIIIMMENLLWRWKSPGKIQPGKIQGNTSQNFYYCCTADLTVMDSSQRVWTSTFYIVYLPCFRRAGGQYLPRF